MRSSIHVRTRKSRLQPPGARARSADCITSAALGTGSSPRAGRSSAQPLGEPARLERAGTEQEGVAGVALRPPTEQGRPAIASCGAQLTSASMQPTADTCGIRGLEDQTPVQPRSPDEGASIVPGSSPLTCT